MDITRFIVFILVFLTINVPVYLQFYYVFLKDKKLWLVILITAVYWTGAIFTENLFPFIAVIFLVFRYHLSKEEESYIRDIDIWQFNWISMLSVSVMTLMVKGALALVNALYILILNYFTNFDIKPQEVVTDFYQSGFWLRLILFFLIVVFAPFVEEYVFRYFLYDKLFLPKMPAAFAAVLSALIFTIAHYNAGGIPSFFGLGLFCNYIYEKKGYFAAVAAHFTFNLSTIVLLFFIKA